MNKPKGGRGKIAPYRSTHVRVPEPIKADIQRLIDDWHEKQGSTQEWNTLTDNSKPLTDIDSAVLLARSVLGKKKSARASLQQFIELIWGTEVDL